jgi:ubiquinone/menaquinone biosynthesis C-methylase UbiE
MDKPIYEYHGMLAETWDLFRGDTSQSADKAFYRTIIHHYGQPALDVGCGTGRLLLDYLQEGIDVEGVDNSPDMLAVCRHKAANLGLQPTLYEGWMESLNLPRRYHTILVPSSTFQLLADVAAAEAAIGRLYRHLEPGGVLVIPFQTFWKAGNPLLVDWVQIGERARPEDGALIRRWWRMRFNPESQVHDLEEERFEVVVNGQVTATEHYHRPNAFRWYTPAQAIALYAGAGFTDIQTFKGFTFEPATDNEDGFCVLGQK